MQFHIFVYAKRQDEEAPNMNSQVTTTPLLRSKFQYLSNLLQVFVCQMFLIISFPLCHFNHFVSEEDNALRSITDLMMTEQRTTVVELQYTVNTGLLLIRAHVMNEL